MGIVEALLPLAVTLTKIVVENVTATAARRAELLAEADAEFAKCRATVLGLMAQVAASDAAADAIADAKPSADEITKP